jgi:hypothetical protein
MTLPGLAGSFHFRGTTSRRPSQKKVTSLLLFTAEKFAAVDDKLKKKDFSPWARGFPEEVRKPGFRRFKFREVRYVASKTIHCRKNNEDYDGPYY